MIESDRKELLLDDFRKFRKNFETEYRRPLPFRLFFFFERKFDTRFPERSNDRIPGSFGETRGYNYIIF